MLVAVPNRSFLVAVAIAAPFFLPFLSAVAHAADYYVAATNGSNGNPGTMNSPWATLQYAATMVQPGDVVHALAGNHVGFELRQGGTAEAPIRFVADPGAAITQRNSVTLDGISIQTADYVIVDGFTVNGMPRAGVRCQLSRFVTIRRVHADSNARWGIFSDCCPDLIVEDNVTSRSVSEHGIYASNSADRPIIRRNVSFSNASNGIHMNGDIRFNCGDVAQQDGVISGATVEQNILYDNGSGGGSGINCDGVADSVIRNNLIYNTHANGISLYRIDGGAAATNNRIMYNTVVVAEDGRWALNITDGSTGNFVHDNIFLTFHAVRGSIAVSSGSRTGFSSDYNVVTPLFSPDGTGTTVDFAPWQALGYDTHSISSTPAAVFTDPVADFRPSPTSPAIDKAEAASGVEVDLAGYLRPAGGGYDIGAYERNGRPAPDAGTPDTARPQPDLAISSDASDPSDSVADSMADSVADLVADLSADLATIADAGTMTDDLTVAPDAGVPDVPGVPDTGDGDAPELASADADGDVITADMNEVDGADAAIVDTTADGSPTPNVSKGGGCQLATGGRAPPVVLALLGLGLAVYTRRRASTWRSPSPSRPRGA